MNERSGMPDAAAAKRRILLVDDHPLMRAGLCQLINSQPDLVVAGEAGNPAEALQAMEAGGVDLVLSDLGLPRRNGLEFIKDVRVRFPAIAILVLSMHDEMIYAERVLRAGARGYIMKEAGGERVLAAVRHVLAGQVYVSHQVSALLLDSFAGHRTRESNSPFGKLTDREFEVFELIGKGWGLQDIARQLGVSPKTVEVHRASIRAKLGLADSTALIQYAVRWIETQG